MSITPRPANGIPAEAADPDHRFAVVTGASSGIGLELARLFAADGHDVLVVAEDAAIEGIPGQLIAHGQHAEALQVDLATAAGVDELRDRIAEIGRPLDAIALNAGFAVGGGSFLETPLDDHLRMIDLNVKGVVHLAHHVASDMVLRGEGKILVTSSVAALLPGPYYATYAASKSFVQSFTEALREEIKDQGVTVTALQPGPVDTAFFDRADMDDTQAAKGPKTDPADVAQAGYEALQNGDDHVVAGAPGKLMAAAAKILPDPLKAKLHGSMGKPTDDD
ncbi:unannotated protein [freshwater metagenome]|uniref:Unannotated protein n=1 Tax=freshwater metagenome TaxID=449393 RepID=A0A6J7FB84_9ZZZZ|nr:SDR family NAD(P)-dependent oxidoreductase [Actinomycetota bacterium]